jgi:hypothetical protein
MLAVPLDRAALPSPRDRVHVTQSSVFGGVASKRPLLRRKSVDFSNAAAGAGAPPHFRSFKGYANTHRKVQVYDIKEISAA